MRCLALAETLRANGVDVSFVCRDLPGNAGRVVRQAGFPLHQLPQFGDCAVRDESGWFGGVDWATDAKQTMAVVSSGRAVDWLFADHYGIDHRWESHLRPAAGRIAVIDDLANRRHECDLLVDQNLHADTQTRYHGLVPPESVVFCGPKYALLRPEFARARAALKTRDGQLKRILVSFGGTDAANQTCKALQAIASLDRRDIAVDVVVGASNRHQVAVRELCEAHSNFTLYLQSCNMAELMAAADLCIGAGGVTTWERCCLGLPSVVISVAANQEASIRIMAEEGRLLYLGTHAEVKAESIVRVLAALEVLPHWLQLLAARSVPLVDGRGAERVVRQILLPAICLRLAGLQDCRDIYEWRNAAENRQHSFDSGVFAFADHEAWYKATLSRSDRVLLIGEAHNSPVGVLRYDLKGQCANVSVYLVPGKHCQGLGSKLLHSGSEWLRKNHPEVREVLADIQIANQASQAAFSQAGYEPYFCTHKLKLRQLEHEKK